MKITKPGIIYDMAAADYHADPTPEPSFSQSIGKMILDQSPAHARLAHPRLHTSEPDEEPEKYDASRAIGDAAHALLIGRGKTIAVADFNNWQSGDAKKFKLAALNSGQTPILAKHMARAYAMVEVARKTLNAMAMPFEGAGEVVLAWQERGLWLRTMIDLLPNKDVVIDYKSTALSCAPHAVEDRPSVLGWDIQAAMHERGLDVLDPENAGRREHYYINQENEPPYALTVVEISEADLTLGRKKLAMAFDIWAHCLKNNTWPAYPPQPVLSRPRGYLETKWLEREVAHEERNIENLLAG